MPNFRSYLKIGCLAGLKRGGRSFGWICRIIIPVSLLVTLLQWTGWLNQLSFLLSPLMNLINLPFQAALPIIGGMLMNVYVTIAAMSALPFTIEQMKLIIVFTLICHNLIIEGIIQHKSGINVIKITPMRIAAAILTVLIASQFLGDTSQSLPMAAQLTFDASLLMVLKDWAVNLMTLLLKILGIIMVIMIMLELSQSLGWTKRSVRFFRPLMKVLGLPEQAATLWVISVVFGLTYGGAVTIDEAKRGILNKEELERLHISIGINHSMVEDPPLFLALGINPFWIWVPKLLMAIIAVQLYQAIRYLKNKLIHRWT